MSFKIKFGLFTNMFSFISLTFDRIHLIKMMYVYGISGFSSLILILRSVIIMKKNEGEMDEE